MSTLCSTGKYWDNKMGICREYSPGFYEKNCSSPCRYPYYGLSCQNNCQCSSEFCSNVLGCHSDNIKALNIVRKFIAQECPIGFYGPNCSKPCRFPNYGLGCQRMCRCNESDCNNIIGCTVGMDTTVVTESYEIGDQFENSSMVVRTVILASTITGALVIILSIIVVTVLIRRRFRRVFTTENRYNIQYI